MITNTVADKSKFAAIYNAGFKSPEDDFYTETLQELRDELRQRDAIEQVDGDQLTSDFQCSILISNKWLSLPLDNIFSDKDFYSEDEWKRVLGIN